MNVSTYHNLEVLTIVMNTAMRALAADTEDGEVTADDLIDFFGLGVAAVIDNDAHLKTPRDLRLAAETAGKLIEGRVKEFCAMQDHARVSWLTITLERGTASTN